MSEGGIGSVSVRVTPDANDFWNEFRRRTEPGASEAGRAAGRRVREGMQGELARPVDVRVNANTSDVQAATRQTNALRDAIVLLGPAAVPVGGVLAGAFAGAVPVLATAALGIKGISDELKSGQLAGTQYGADISALKNEFSTLKGIAAGGILPGVDQALKSSGPLFKAVNSDVSVMSAQLGQIVGSAAPALVSILTALNPLFVTFGNLIASGAAKLEHFATSGTGLQSFVSYVQAELPTVVHALGQLIEFAGRLVVSLAPIGNAILTGIGLLAQVLNAIPTNVLTELSTGAIAAYAAFRTYGLISGIVEKVTASRAAGRAADAAAAAQAQASALIAENASRQQAVVVTESNAAQARSALAAAEEIAAAVAGTGSVLEESAIANRAASAQFVAGEEAKALAARTAAGEISAASVATAETVVAEGEASAVGWSAALGPIGALVIGVGILGATLFTSSDAAQAAASAQDSYTESVKKSTDALNTANLTQTVSNLGKDGALTQLDALHRGNAALGLSYGDLTKAVNGTDEQYQRVKSSLLDYINYTGVASNVTAKNIDTYRANKGAAGQLLDTINNLRSGLSNQIKLQIALDEAQRQAKISADGGTGAVRRQAAALGATSDAYVAAQQATQKNIEKTQKQTVEWQLANDAGSLLAQTLDKLSGNNLSYAQAQNSFEQSLVSIASNLKSGSAAVEGLSQAAIANRGALLSSVTSAESSAEAYGKMRKSSIAARSKLIELRQQLIDNAVAHGEDRDAVTKYVDSVLQIPGAVTAANATQLEAHTVAAQKKVDDLKARINAIKQDRVPGVDVNSAEARGLIASLQRQIDRLTGKRIGFFIDATLSPAFQAALAFAHSSGGLNSQPTSRIYTQAVGTQAAFGQRTIPPNTVFTVGEAGWEGGVTDSQGRASIFSNSQSKAMGFASPTRYAGGTGSYIATLDPVTGQQIGAGSSIVSLTPPTPKKPATVKVHFVYDVEGKQYSSLIGAENAATALFKGQVALGLKIDRTDLPKFLSSLKGTAVQVNDAFNVALKDTEKLGLSAGMVKYLAAEDHALVKEVDNRNKVAAKLAAVNQLFVQERATVRAAITGSFDVTTAGTGFNGQQKVTGANILAQQTQAVNRVKLFVKDLELAARKGIPQSYLQQLAEKGPDALPEVQAILTLNKSQAKQLYTNAAGLNRAGDALGGFIGKNLYGGQINALTGQVKADNALIDRLGDRIDKGLQQAADVLAGRPVIVKVGDREIARATASGLQKNARR